MCVLTLDPAIYTKIIKNYLTTFYQAIQNWMLNLSNLLKSKNFLDGLGFVSYATSKNNNANTDIKSEEEKILLHIHSHKAGFNVFLFFDFSTFPRITW